MKDTPPQELFTGQDGQGYTIVNLLVRLCCDEFGRVWSWHDVNPTDVEKLKQWPSGGVKQIAYGLLLEAVRRETFASALVLMSSDESFLQKYQTIDDKNETVKQLTDAVMDVLTRNIQPLLVPAAKEILTMLTHQV